MQHKSLRLLQPQNGKRSILTKRYFFLHKISLTQRAYFRFISKTKLINIFVGKCARTVVDKLIWGRKCDLTLTPYTGFQRATLELCSLKFQTEPLIFFNNCEFLHMKQRGVGPPTSTWWAEHDTACLGMKTPWPFYKANGPHHSDVRGVFKIGFITTSKVQFGPLQFVVH